ncbi:hypothetical protein PISMIDRAFT_677257 [Pisolithus microcarpus 441]|uniref:Uncharacterized protein n=1 Tax=Pisolithus microcarpus 441 TaxID=765257 RepID=A0A0C9ZHE3_9AGAM|nr:hypothetical protein PISMIDRAFT_677257 [Pisolithus microcarpus 441]
MEPKLTADGCNWHTYGGWVLKAISEDDLMGYLKGNEKLSQSGELLMMCGNSGLLWPTTLSFPAYLTLS